MPELTEQNKKDLKAAFQKFDLNGDGKISTKELLTVLRNVGQNPTDAQAEEMIQAMDRNGNGTIEYPEFLEYMSKRGMNTPKQEEDQVHEAFKLLDRDCNGFVTAEELKYFVTHYGERMTNEEAEAMIKEADCNCDGKVNYTEFAQIIAGTKQKQPQ